MSPTDPRMLNPDRTADYLIILPGLVLATMPGRPETLDIFPYQTHSDNKRLSGVATVLSVILEISRGDETLEEAKIEEVLCNYPSDKQIPPLSKIESDLDHPISVPGLGIIQLDNVRRISDHNPDQDSNVVLSLSDILDPHGIGMVDEYYVGHSVINIA